MSVTFPARWADSWENASLHIEEAANRMVSWWGRCKYPPNEHEDLIQICRIAGWKAWRRHGIYDRSLLYKFMRWALNVERRRVTWNTHFPDEALCPLADDYPASADTQREALARMELQELSCWLRALPRRQRLCLIGSAIGMDRHEIAQVARTTGKWSVRNALWKARRKLCS